MRKPKFLVPVLMVVAGLALAGCIRSKEKLFDESKAITPFKGNLTAVRMTNHGTVSLSTSSGGLRQEIYELRGKVYSHTLKKQEFTIHNFPGRENWYILQVMQPSQGKPAYYYVVAFKRGAAMYQLNTQGNRSTQRIVQAAGVKFTVEKNNMFFASADDVVKGYEAIIKEYARRARRMSWVRYYVATSDAEKAELKKAIDTAKAEWQKAKASWSKGEPE